MKQDGFTLLEVMLSIALLTIIAGMLFTLGDSFKSAARLQESQMTAMGDTRLAMLQTSRELRQAAMSSIVMNGNRDVQIQYQIPADVSGNGLPVDQTGRLELGPVRTIMRDTADLNNDGQTVTQLILTDGNQVRVLANNLVINEDVNGDGVLGAAEDLNGNGVLDVGLLFERVGNAIRVTVQAEDVPNPTGEGRAIISTMRQTIRPRN
jgi:prepilin-type N-terminal cleavage/methylation domain-containing protein